jgi:hypothetical protein
MAFLRNLMTEMQRDPLGTFFNIALQILVYGFGIYIVLTAGKCATHMIASAI